MSIAGVVLAAGASTRLGRPKQTVLLGEHTLVERAVKTARAAELSPVIVVVRPATHFANALRQLGCIVVVNPQAEEGLASSIRAGILALDEKGIGAVLMTCDQPATTAAHLRCLCAGPDAAAGSAYAGQVGVPAYFPAAAFPALLDLRGDTGAKGLLTGARAIRNEDLALDVDTEADIRRAEALLGSVL